MKTQLAFLLTALFYAPVSAVPPQPLTTIFEEQFGPIASEESPGFAVGIVEKGDLVASTYAGMANLETATPIGPETRFYIGSISKQFTAALIGKLVLEGRLDLTDSVREHLPFLSNAYDPVTIADCLFHTGGVREYTSLLLLRGDNPALENKMGQAEALKLIADQQVLDFPPGSEQRYSSSGYVLLAAIVEKLEGKSFAETAAKRLFGPLDMQETHFDDDHAAVVTGRASAYRPGGIDGWQRWLKHFDVVGDGGVLTTIPDMAKWDAELTTGAILGPELRDWMLQRGALRDGTLTNAAAGLWHGNYRGQNTISHGGGLGGFIADQLRFPDLGLSVYVFANRNDNAAFQAWALADQLLDQRGIERTANNPEKTEVAVAGPQYNAWLGAYFLEGRNNRRFIQRDDQGRLVLQDGGENFSAFLQPVDDQTLRTGQGGNLISLSFEAGVKAIHLQADTYSWNALHYDDSPPVEVEQIAAHAGRYCSTELEAVVSFRIDEGRFSIRYSQQTSRDLFPVEPTSNIEWNGIDRVWVGSHMIKFRRNAVGETTGLGMGDGRVSNVEFTRC